MRTHCTLFSSLLKSVHRPKSLCTSSALGVLYRRGRSSLGNSAIQTSLRNSWPTFRPTNCNKSYTHKHFKFKFYHLSNKNSYLKLFLIIKQVDQNLGHHFGMYKTIIKTVTISTVYTNKKHITTVFILQNFSDFISLKRKLAAKITMLSLRTSLSIFTKFCMNILPQKTTQTLYLLISYNQ
jgi:hypothetical protein